MQDTENTEPEEQHEHAFSYSDNGDHTHTKTCSDCDEVVIEDCEYYNGSCMYCGSMEPSSDLISYELNTLDGDTTISVTGMLPENTELAVEGVPVSDVMDLLVNNDTYSDINILNAYKLTLSCDGEDIQPKDYDSTVNIAISGIFYNENATQLPV